MKKATVFHLEGEGNQSVVVLGDMTLTEFGGYIEQSYAVQKPMYNKHGILIIPDNHRCIKSLKSKIESGELVAGESDEKEV